jgi:hypothetical protein
MIVINVFLIILLILSVTLLIMAGVTEPGIIPRHVDKLMENIPPVYREMAEK